MIFSISHFFVTARIYGITEKLDNSKISFSYLLSTTLIFSKIEEAILRSCKTGILQTEEIR
jgi:hypothetical protein